MTLLAGGRLSKAPSKELRSAIRALAKVEDEQVHWDIGDNGDAFCRSYDIIRANGNHLRNPMVHVIDDNKVYPEDRERIVGFVLVPKDFVSLRNRREDYQRPEVACETLLKESVELDTDEQPGGLLVGAADAELIIRDDFLERIRGESINGVKPVFCKGKVLANWNRVRINQRKNIVDDIVFSNVTCAACGHPRVATLMHLWLARKDLPVENAVCNTRGEGDYGETPIIIISKDLMAQFRKDKMTGPKSRLLFEPLYSKQSKRYEVIRKIRDSINK